MTSSLDERYIDPPEPSLTPELVLERAVDMRTMLRESQAECESLRRIPDRIDAAFDEAGFYRVLQPRRFGGYEFDLPSFLRVMMEVARGCPSCGWVLALTSGHAHTLSFFSCDVQAQVYGHEGSVRVPFTGGIPRGTAVRRWRLRGAGRVGLRQRLRSRDASPVRRDHPE